MRSESRWGTHPILSGRAAGIIGRSQSVFPSWGFATNGFKPIRCIIEMYSPTRPLLKLVRAAFTAPSKLRRALLLCMKTKFPIAAMVAAALLLPMLYDLMTFRASMVRNLSTLGAVIADNSTAALAFRNERDAREVLSSLRADPQVVAAALYDARGNLFVTYPPKAPAKDFPAAAREFGHHFERRQLLVFEPISQGGDHLGSVYLRADLRDFYSRLRIYLGFSALILIGSTIVALVFSNRPQSRISGPLRALAQTARIISERGDFSVRAPPSMGDEMGVLTEAFNGMLARIEDQTVALEESRARLSGVFGSAMDAIISVDADQRIKLFNAAAEKMFRCPAKEAIGKPLDIFIPAKFREAHREHVREFGKTGTTSRAMEELRPLTGLRATGEQFPVEASISQVEVAGQKIYTVILRDITERIQAEEQILRMNAQLEARVEQRTSELTMANNELEAFTYSVAHDLRAPLRHIDAFTRILVEEFAGSLQPEARHHLDIIRKGSQNMSRLVDDLLSLARVGRQELRHQPIPLNPVVNEVIAELTRENEQRLIEWRVGILPTVSGDPGLLKQVFANLLSNAVKYTRPRNPAVIEIGNRRENGEAVIFVHDNGVGFNMKYANKLFGVFQRLHRADEFEGTGVGLAIVDRVVRRHGGRIWAISEVDQGATFVFTLQGLENNGGPG